MEEGGLAELVRRRAWHGAARAKAIVAPGQQCTTRVEWLNGWSLLRSMASTDIVCRPLLHSTKSCRQTMLGRAHVAQSSRFQACRLNTLVYVYGGAAYL